MKPKISHIIQYVVFFGLAFFLLWYTSRKISFNELFSSITAAPLHLILSIVGIGFFSHFLRALRWILLIETIDKKPKLSNTVLSVMIGYIVNLATPRLGEVARCGVLAKYEKIPVEKLAGTMVAERLIDVLTLILVSFLTFFVEMDIVKTYMLDKLSLIKEKLPEGGFMYISLGVVALVAIVIYFFYKKLQNNNSKLSKIYKNVVEGIGSVFKLKKIGLFILYSFAIWFCYWAMVYIGFQTLSGTSNLGGGAGLSVLTLGSLGIIATPGGAGAYQLIVQNILNSLYNIEEKSAIIFANLSWAVQTIVLIVGGIASFIILPIINKDKSKE